MTYTKTKLAFIFVFVLSLCSVGFCGKIVYPWNATCAIVKVGDSFQVWYDADAGQTIKSVKLRGPYNSVSMPEVTCETGSWTYDAVSGAGYNTRISVFMPANTPAERYDLIVNTSTGKVVSLSAVKVVKDTKTEYSLFHLSDTHICDESVRPPDGVPARLRLLSALVDTANIIGPEIVFLTGDNVNSRSWDKGNATYLKTWPSTQERVDFYYKGSHENGYRGVYDFSAPAFSCNGNHDYYERPADGLETSNKYEFWNKYHGVRTHHFAYGDARFMAFCDAFDKDNDAEAVQHTAWLDEVGPGTLRIIYKHFFNIVPQPWATDHDIQFGMVGHNHHKGVLNPHTQGTTDMYIANFTEYSTFNLFRVGEKGEYTVLNNLPAIENPRDDPSEWRRRLTLDYAKANDGKSHTNTATVVNKFDVGFPRARVRFVMPKGASYVVSRGTVEQAFDGDSVHVVDVRVNLLSHSTAEVKIRQAGVPEPTLTEVPYGEHERHVLDFWQAESSTPTPLAFVIHGGGWQGGSKERVSRFVDIEQLLAAGISVAAINYRYVSHAPEAGVEPPVKLPLYDAARALQFIRSKAGKWNIDKTRIGAAGGSAGACSSLWLAYHDDLADPDSPDLIARESTRLQCAAVIGAQTSLDPKQMKAWTPNSRYGGHAFGKRNFQQFLAERESILPWIAEYSPYALVTPDDPPMCLLYSTPPALGQDQKDPTHTSNFGVKLQEKCNSINVPCEFVYSADVKTRHTMAADFLIKTLLDPAQPKYSDGRPVATLRMDAKDHGIVLRYGDGPDDCDALGARDVWVFEDDGTYYMHYDAAGPKGWLSSLAVSQDLLTWEKKGPILDFGKPGEDDSAGACYGVTYKDAGQWHMFYLGTPNASPAPALVPSFPYLTMKARASSPAGPWIKQKDVVPFRTKSETYYSHTASPGHVITQGDEYLQFFSSTTQKPGNPCVQRTLGIARTKNLDGAWTVDPDPMVPIEEQIENSTLYYEKDNQTWFLFTNHIGIDQGEYTDAIWVYWSKDLNQWDPKDKAVVLDGENCTWSSKCIGLPSVVQVGQRLALFYDAPGGNSTSHMKRHVGLAWLDLPLKVPQADASREKSIKVTDLQCESLGNPLGIDQTKPQLSWKLESAERGQRQTAYRLLVASSADQLNKNMGDLWDSGKVNSDQSIHVAYGGKVLESRMQCVWKVKVWDKDGRASDWSDAAQWSMGLLHPEDWKAQWIGVTTPLKAQDVTLTKATYQTLDASVAVDVTAIVKQALAKNKPLTVDFKTLGGDPARGVVKELVVEYSHEGKPGMTRAKDFETLKWDETPTAPFYRQSFNVDRMPERAIIYITPLGYFELYVNGRKVGDEVLAPAVSNFSKRSYYRTYDVTGYLKKGVNNVGIWMGTGWYSPGLPGVKHDSPVVRAQLEFSGHGKDQLIITDTTWQTKPSERALLGEWRWGKFGGERVDARKLDTTWWDTQTSKAGWTSVVEVDVADVPCTAQTCAGNVELASIAPQSVQRLDEDTVLVDFGTNLTGLMAMTFRDLKPGQKVSLYYGDLDGRQEAEAWRAKQTHKGFAVYGQFDEFISAGAAGEPFRNVFNYHAFRYVLIEGLSYVPDMADMAAVPVETEVAEVGTFSCSNDLYNRIHNMVRWTYRCLNLGGQTVDCPHRERLGYGDGQTIMDTGLFNFDAASMYAKWAWNWWDEQTEDGYVPFTAPCPHGTGGGPAWGAMCVVVPWKTYLFSSDRRLLEEGYPYMKKYMDYLSAHCDDDILQEIFPGEKWPNLGDWVPPRRGMDTTYWPDNTMRLVFNNCYRVYLLEIMEQVAGLLGHAGDEALFERDRRVAQGKIHQTFFDPKNNTYANGEQPYLIFPLKTGVTPGPLKNAVFEKYVETLLVTDKGHLNTGMIGTQIMVDYLLEQDRNDLVDQFVSKTTYPGWGYMVEKGATTCWEQWNGYYSQIHSCFPYIGGWFYRGLGGIQWDPKTPGFKHVILRPAVVRTVDWVKCSYVSAYGEISSHWKLENGSFLWDITVPVNSTATVHVPAKDVKSVREGGHRLQQADGVTFLRMEAGRAVLRVESGTYKFTSQYDRGNN